MRIKIPILTVSESNIKEHWGKSAARHKDQKETVRIYLKNQKNLPDAPWHITLTRVSPRKLDSHDNLRTSLKYIADAVAEFLTGGKVAGRSDDDKRITWHYDQQQGFSKEYAVLIDIQECVCDS